MCMRVSSKSRPIFRQGVLGLDIVAGLRADDEEVGDGGGVGGAGAIEMGGGFLRAGGLGGEGMPAGLGELGFGEPLDELVL